MQADERRRAGADRFLSGAADRPLCVECRGCARKAVFPAGSPEAAAPVEDTKRRLKCRHCGARPRSAFHLSDDREARRWLADR